MGGRAAVQWKEDLDSKVMLASQEPVPCLLIANKVRVREAKAA